MSILHIWDLKSFPHNDTFWRIWEKSFLKKLWENEKLLVHNVFYSIKDKNYHFSYIQFVVCKCFHFGMVKNFVTWEWVKGRNYQESLCPERTQSDGKHEANNKVFLPSTSHYRLLTHLGKTPLWKTLWEKEKMLDNSIFSFTHNFFYPFRGKSHDLSNI